MGTKVLQCPIELRCCCCEWLLRERRGEEREQGRRPLTTPGSVELEQDVLGRVENDRIEGLADDYLDGLIVGLRDGLGLEVRLDGSVQHSGDVLLNVLLVELNCLIKRPALTNGIHDD